jgi:hypothetical protein
MDSRPGALPTKLANMAVQADDHFPRYAQSAVAAERRGRWAAGR